MGQINFIRTSRAQEETGRKLLWALNDWLAETGLYEMLQPETLTDLGALLVTLRRAERSEQESPNT